MGTHRPRAGAEVRLPPLSALTPKVKPPPDRLYGRARGHALRPRQRALLEQALPRLAVRDPADPVASFPVPPSWLWLEVGFGSGEHALAQIAAHPRTGLIACEVFENGIAALLSRLVPDGADPLTAPLPDNLRIWPSDARGLLQAMPPASLDGLVLLFPDPWPKARHAKRRFVHPALLPVVARAMREDAEWRIASDDPTYQDWVEAVMADQALFSPDGVFDTRPDGWPGTRYEAKAVAAGRTPRWWRFRRRPSVQT